MKLWKSKQSAETRAAGGLFKLPCSFFFTFLHFPIVLLRFLVLQRFPSSQRTLIYSFFFSFCFISLLISLLAMPAYFVMMPCWFRPGSSSRKLTATRRTKKVCKDFKSDAFSQHVMNFDTLPVCVWNHSLLLWEKWNHPNLTVTKLFEGQRWKWL